MNINTHVETRRNLYAVEILCTYIYILFYMFRDFNL